MSNGSWDNLREILKRPPTPESMREAAEAFGSWEAVKKTRSNPVLCSLSSKKDYPSAIPLSNIKDVIATNPKFYELMRKVVGLE